METALEERIQIALSKAVEFLETQGYRYAVIGGIANQVWGTPRFTQDVDLKVFVPDVEYPAVRAAIRTAFPERGRPHVPENPLIVDVNIGGIIVDFLLAIPGYEEQIVTRAVRRQLGDLEIWICSPEDLIIQKAAARTGMGTVMASKNLKAVAVHGTRAGSRRCRGL